MPMKEDEIKKIVRNGYAKVARQGGYGCGCDPSCCGPDRTAKSVSLTIGYSREDLEAVPEGANLGLGCGNPVALATLAAGETVLDLGSGAGFDAFLAARKVGETGRVIGVDMTPAMLEKARENAGLGGYTNVEFRLGEIEHLPVADASVDVIISNCVINLSPDKPQVFAEAFRVLRPAGRLMVSDIVVTQELPGFIRESRAGYIGCIGGALLRDEYLGCIRNAGFEEIEIISEEIFPLDFIISDPAVQEILRDITIDAETIRELQQSVLSIKVSARKPK
jgi:arsenite methyltransferase